MLRRAAVGLVVASVAVVAMGFGQSGSDTRFRAALNGDKEVGDGDPNGRGTFTARFDGGRLCYRLRFSGLDDPLDAHIHRGRRTENGDIVVALRPRFTDEGARARCVSVSRALRRSIRRRPSSFYVNVHTEEFPDGAIRGQLTRRR